MSARRCSSWRRERDAAVLGLFYLPGAAGEIGLGQVQLRIAGDAPAP